MFYYPFPTGLLFNADYNRSIILSGMKAALTDTINFTLTIDPFNADNYAYIRASVALAHIYVLSTHVLFVNKTCDWLWAFEVGTSSYIQNMTILY